MPRPLRPIDDGLGVPRHQSRQQPPAGVSRRGRLCGVSQGDRRSERAEAVRAVRLLPDGQSYPSAAPPDGRAPSAGSCRACWCRTRSATTDFTARSGHVWQGRFKSPVIQDDEHLLACCGTSRRTRCGRSWWNRPASIVGAVSPLTATAARCAARLGRRPTRRWPPARRRVGGDGRPMSTRTAGRRRAGGHPPQQRDGPALRRAKLGETAGKTAGSRPDHSPPRPAEEIPRGGQRRKIVLTPFFYAVD